MNDSYRVPVLVVRGQVDPLEGAAYHHLWEGSFRSSLGANPVRRGDRYMLKPPVPALAD